MQSGDRKEFDEELAALCAALDVPLGDAKREGFWKALASMSLLEFRRCAEQILRDLRNTGEVPERFSVATVWQARAKLRAPAPTGGFARPEDPEPLDAWELLANRLLLGEIGSRIRADGQSLGEPWSVWQAEAARILARYKRAWAVDMREAQDDTGAVPPDAQRSAWRDCMARADADIGRLSPRVPA